MAFERPKLRAGWLTLLDTLLVATASAALVAALGAQTRFDLAGFRVTIRAATNLILAAGALGALRAWLGGAARLFPAVAVAPPHGHGIIDGERRQIASNEGMSRRVHMLALVAAVGSTIWVIPQLLDLRAVPDAGDPVFSAWRIAVVAHQLVTDPMHLWNGNIFYPRPYTIAYSDSCFLQALIGAPFVLAGADPLPVANLLLAVTFPARGLAFFYTAWRLTGDPEAALVVALMGAWSPFYPQHYSQLELNWSMFVPLSILALLRMLAAPSWKSGLAFGALVALQCLTGMYLAAMMIATMVPLAMIVALAWRVRPSLAVMRAVVATLGVLIPVAAFLGYPYLKARAAHGDRSPREIAEGSALPSDYGDAHFRLAAYGWQARGQQGSERKLFTGTSTLALAAVGALPPLTPVSTGVLIAGAAAFDWSLGSHGLTFDELYRGFSAYRGMRVIARFAVMVQTALVFLAAFGVRRLLRLARSGRARLATCAALCILILADLRMNPGLVPYRQGIPPIYSAVTPEMVLVELPVDPQIDYMYFSTYHWARLLGGYSGFPGYSFNVMEGWKAWPAPASIDYFKKAGATHLTYNCALEERPWRCATSLDVLDAHPGLERVASGLWEGKETRLYRLR